MKHSGSPCKATRRPKRGPKTTSAEFRTACRSRVCSSLCAAQPCRSASCIFYDITYLNSHDDSTIVVPCELSNGVSNNNCYFNDGSTVGVLSTDNNLGYAPAYAIHSQFGWDFTTGIGSPNVTNLANAWPVP